MKPILGGMSEALYALMRFIAGGLFACHGAQKLFGLLGGSGHPHGKFLIAGIVEFGGGVLIALGLFATIAAFIAAGEMAVAYFTVHAHGGLWPIVNHGELAVLYTLHFFSSPRKARGRIALTRREGRSNPLVAQPRKFQSSGSISAYPDRAASTRVTRRRRPAR